jgi:hypothetical protein
MKIKSIRDVEDLNRILEAARLVRQLCTPRFSFRKKLNELLNDHSYSSRSRGPSACVRLRRALLNLAALVEDLEHASISVEIVTDDNTTGNATKL